MLNKGGKTMDKEYIWDFLIESYIATNEEISLVTKINGYTVETLNDILYVRTGYRSVEQMQNANWNK